MKKIFFLFIIIPILTIGQNAETKFVLDSLGKKSDYQNLWKKNPDKAFEVRIAKDTGTVHQMSLPKYQLLQCDYKIIKNEIEKITSQTYSDSTIFLIKFQFLNDNCSSLFSNNFNKELYETRKSYLNPVKRKIEKERKKLVFIMLFEKQIYLYKNYSIESKKEYFYNDSGFFKENIFLRRALCGSMCLINFDGRTLLQNGEYSTEAMANHLEPNVWNTLFSTTNVNEKIEVKE
jgi:hypothetical protein